MASTTRILNPRVGDTDACDSLVGISAQCSTLITFNLSTLAANAPSYNPIEAIKDSPSTTNHANILRVRLPDGINYLDLYHEWTGGSGTPGAPTTRPKVRVFGATPPRLEDHINQTWPSDIDASYGSPGTTRDTEDWVPLADDSGNTLIELGNATDPAPFSNGTSQRSAPSTVRTRGTREVIVLIDTIAAGITIGCVIGQIGR